MGNNTIACGLLISFLLLVGVHKSLAGAGYDLRCADHKCGFSTAATIGGGFSFEQAGGFCKSVTNGLR